jgi:hypothetical protein
MITGLDDVAGRGGPAQQAAARLIIAAIEAQGETPELVDAAEALVDGYLNDPHLTR